MVTHTPRIHGDRRAKPLYMEEKYGSKKISRVFSAIIILMMEIQNVIWLITQSSLIARIQRVGVVVEGVLIGSAVRLDR